MKTLKKEYLMGIEDWAAFLEKLWEKIIKMQDLSSSDQMMIFAVVYLILLVIAIAIIWFLPHRRRARRRWKRIRKEAKSFLREMKARRKPPIVPTNVVLMEGEVGVLQEPSMLYEPYRFDDRGGSGSDQRLRRIDSGRIILTNRRLIFDGQWKDRMVNLSEIKSARPLEEAVEVRFSKNQKSQIYLVRNPIIWAKTIPMLASGKISIRQGTAQRSVP
jgi:hypothetical protein